MGLLLPRAVREPADRRSPSSPCERSSRAGAEAARVRMGDVEMGEVVSSGAIVFSHPAAVRNAASRVLRSVEATQAFEYASRPPLSGAGL